jgi:RHS repeat-associated protein
MHPQILKKNSSIPYVFQGQESDDEISGEGNSVNYKYRMHDPRLGRFFAVDPLASHYSYNYPYAFSENVLINCIELEGLEKINHLVYTKKEKKWVIKWTETDNNLKENVNAYHRFNNQGQNYQTVVKPWVKGSGHKESVDYDGNIKSGSDNRHNMYLLFKSTAEAKMTESERDQMAAVNNSVSKDATHYDSWEGGDDGGNTGGSLGGEHGWNNGGKQLFFGTIGLVCAPIAFGTATTFGGYASATISTANSIDDVGGLMVEKNNNQYQSLSQSFASSQEGKQNISRVKGFLGLLTLSYGTGATVYQGLNQPLNLGTVVGGVGIIIDGVQSPSNVKEVSKSIDKK